MSPMDHAEAHERIADLALEPQVLSELAGSTSRADAALREHVMGCARCRAELAEWRELQLAVAAASAAGSLDSIAPPPELRAMVLAAAHAEGKVGPAIARSGRSSARRRPISLAAFRARRAGATLLALAAVLALVAVGLGTWVINDQARINAAAEDSRALTGLAGAISRVLAAPDNHVVGLHSADGVVGGSIAWSRHDLIVTASSLSTPPAGQIYRCWLVYEGAPSAIGEMRFAGKTAFWLGWTDDWATIGFEPDAQFVISLEPDQASSAAPRGPIVLEATLGS